MRGPWERYPAIKKIFGEEWLNNPKNATHPLITHCDETEYFNNLNKYLAPIEIVKKTTKEQLKNRAQFFDVYYELEIAYFLRELGLAPQLHETISGRDRHLFRKREISHRNST